MGNEMKFREVQRFNQWWLWVLLILTGTFLFIIGTGLGAIALIGIGLFLLSIRLTTQLDSEAIKMNLFPLVKKKVYWSEVESAQVVDYGFVGGWGIRFLTAYGTVYNIKGSKGLALELKDGSKFCIGTQKEAELITFLRNIGVEAQR